jgi:hypothetical protein
VKYVDVIGVKKLSYKLRKNSKVFAAGGSKRVLTDIGKFMHKSILTRTAQGKDVDGKKFVPYSPSYKKVRAAAGLSTGLVNLRFSGDMLGAMAYVVNTANKTVRISFQNTRDRKGIHNAAKAYYNQRRRKFLGISIKESEKIRDMTREHIRRYLHK